MTCAKLSKRQPNTFVTGFKDAFPPVARPVRSLVGVRRQGGLVGAEDLNLRHPGVQTRRATGLRYAPTLE